MRIYLTLAISLLALGNLDAQSILPSITVKNFSGKIIVSWRNQYPLEVKVINVQRSFDSLKNFSTIGSVLNPQNEENGFVDEAPPYNKMYYRVFISFEGGDYIFSESARPVKELPPPQPLYTQESVVDPFKKAELVKQPLKEPSKKTDEPPAEDKKAGVTKNPKDKKAVVSARDKNAKQPGTKKNKTVPSTETTDGTENKTSPEETTGEGSGYPSKRIYTSRDYNVVINLPHADNRRYSIRFFDEENKFLFELNRVRENYLIIEKVNFLHAGWFYFELFENGKMIEKNKLFIPKEGRN